MPLNIVIKKNLEKDINEIFKQYLIDENLHYLDDDLCFFQYMNFIERSIHPKPRKVLEASTFYVPEKLKKSYEILKTKITEGLDINIYLSNRIFDTNYVDDLFNFEDLVHFHLGSELEIYEKNQKSVIKRSKELAIALVKDDCIIFLAIKNHEDEDIWNNSGYLDTLSEEFPNQIAYRELKELSSDRLTDEEIENARKLGINYTYQSSSNKCYSTIPVLLGTKAKGFKKSLKSSISRVRAKHSNQKIRLIYTLNHHVEDIKNEIVEKQNPGIYEIKLLKILKMDQFLFQIKLIFNGNSETEIILKDDSMSISFRGNSR
ncbi:hypothetical protein B9T31_17240 [Acinetobacter sp. ANC 4558]|uniref:hypothetical protein n=1 Tax=Acinetobacter sp. ANC 4558 TaxID=1977876 RepID=UPI000A332E0E|nr:hypothetical protein [Acinetobacter sp. ANC 4558]OTG79240.1 hypothetical protein B9T31_17240 [Acinetobacter sp. ANC 4558]